MPPIGWHILISVLIFAGVAMLVYHGWCWVVSALAQMERWYDRVLVHQLLIDVHPRVAVGMSVVVVVFGAMVGYGIGEQWFWALIGAVLAAAVPNLVVRHLEQKRHERLEMQLVDGITTLASGVRAGLNLGQAIDLLVSNSGGPLHEEFAQLQREYQMGLDLNQAMRNAANRIGSRNYRLLFTALEMHRLRGGDMAESLDRICESVREIQRLEGKLDALTAQGRFQAWMMAALPFVFFVILYVIDPEGATMLVTEPIGRILLLVSVVLIVFAYSWIRRIMAVDI